MSFNKVLLIGNTGRDPEVRHLESGVAVATFTLATTERYKDRNGVMQDQTEWHNIVEGKIRTRSWTDQNGQKRFTTEIVADNIRLLGKKGDSSSAQSPAGYGAPQGGYGMPQGSYGAPQPMPQQNMGAASPQPAADFPMEDASDDLPF